MHSQGGILQPWAINAMCFQHILAPSMARDEGKRQTELKIFGRVSVTGLG